MTEHTDPRTPAVAELDGPWWDCADSPRADAAAELHEARRPVQRRAVLCPARAQRDRATAGTGGPGAGAGEAGAPQRALGGSAPQPPGPHSGGGGHTAAAAVSRGGGVGGSWLHRRPVALKGCHTAAGGARQNSAPCAPGGGAALLRTPDRRWSHSARTMTGGRAGAADDQAAAALRAGRFGGGGVGGVGGVDAMGGAGC